MYNSICLTFRRGLGLDTRSINMHDSLYEKAVDAGWHLHPVIKDLGKDCISADCLVIPQYHDSMARGRWKEMTLAARSPSDLIRYANRLC